MSLLLDALRRASAKRDDPLAERLEVGRHVPAAEENTAGPSARDSDTAASAPRTDTARDEDDLSLVPEPDRSPASESRANASTPPAEPAGPSRGESSQRERAATEALLQAGAGGQRRRGSLLLGVSLGVLALVVALAGGGWLWHMQSQDEVASALGGYRPEPGEVEPAANSEVGLSPSALDPETAGNANQPAQPEQTAQPDQSSSDTDSSADARPADSDSPQEDASADSDGTPDADGATGVDAEATVESTDAGTPAEPEDQIAQAAAQLAGERGEADAAAQSGAASEQARDTASGGGESTTASTASTKDEAPDADSESGTAGSSSEDTRDLVATSEPDSRQRQSARTAAAQPPRPMIRQAEGTPLVEALDTGYQALTTGDLATAEEAYGRARRLAPDNRDALLGTAAVRQRQGATDAARRLYLRVLDSYPRDPHAQAALAALDAGASRRNETTLKMLLRENPNAPALHYALGNVYAAEARWSEARMAYARAVNAAPEDPDYAYNLAVALDHLGRRDAARRAYGRALGLTAGAAADFDPAAVRRRLQQLR